MKAEIRELNVVKIDSVTYQIYEDHLELDRYLRYFNNGNNTLFIDLSLGETRPFECFVQLAAQIPSYEDNFTEQSKGITQANYQNTWEDIGYWIDRETRGELITNVCLQECNTLLPLIDAAGIKYILVIAPLDESLINETSITTLNCLGTYCKQKIIVLATQGFRIHDNWQQHHAETGTVEQEINGHVSEVFRLLPGVISEADFHFYKQFSSGNDELIKIHNSYLVPPSKRKIDRQEALKHLRGLKLLAKKPSYLLTYVFTAIDSTDYSMISSGWDSFYKGDSALAIRILEYCVAAEDSEFSRYALDVLQVILIAAQKYDEAQKTAGLFESANKTSQIAAAWGGTLTGQNLANHQLLQEKADIAKKDSGTIEDLYFLNISALSHFKQGKFSEALELEHILAEKLKVRNPTLWHLVYINFLNTARLYRFDKNYKLADEYFSRALDLNIGVLNEFTSLFHNLMLAKLWESRQEQNKADLHWLKCLFIWLDTPNKLALPWRLYASLVKEKNGDHRKRAMVFENELLKHVDKDAFFNLVTMLNGILRKSPHQECIYNYSVLSFVKATTQSLLHKGRFVNEANNRDIPLKNWDLDIDPMRFDHKDKWQLLDRGLRLGMNHIWYAEEFHEVEHCLEEAGLSYIANPAITSIETSSEGNMHQCVFKRLRESQSLSTDQKLHLSRLLDGERSTAKDTNPVIKELAHLNLVCLQK